MVKVKKKAKSGRKALPDAEKMVLIGFYAKRSKIDNQGGFASVREKLKNFFDSLV